ncbi:glycosyltransferase family 4 protein [Flavobacterium sp. LB2P53]|uniref:glycosyltransferase family 4 protein n=1 Tax=Flavobacterium sp. LB2P53 TaxID=2497481 RepID=UPI000F838487|nr:glycosyltransferase family 4 protein [Flavobacterium sp. LB2P53]RTY71267.1 glycosyltransferase [Flavobacterium sp. LB2P53]RTY95469.1 glycosyltransferase [Flavobacterium sp. GSN2]
MINSKKIFFTTENISWGGSELLWSRTVAELSQFSFSIAVCVHEKLKLPQELLSLEKDSKIQIFIHSNSILSIWKRMLNRFLPYRKRFKSSNLRHKFILDFNPDLIVMNQGFNFNAVDLMLFALKNNLSFVTISHAVNEGLWPNLDLRKKMLQGFNKSQKNYFVSHDNLLVTQNQLGIILDNAAVIRNPYNVSFAIDLDFPKLDTFHLAFVGRYDFCAKGQDVLLQVLAETKWKSRNLWVNFYGEGNDVENLKDLVEMYQLTNVMIHSHTATEEIWKMNQGLILTSRFEGLPIVVVEAMLCKRLVIVTNVSGNAEFVQDNESGFIAAAPRPEYVDEALERAWEQRKNWEAIGNKAREEIITLIPENPAVDFANELNYLLSSL